MNIRWLGKMLILKFRWRKASENKWQIWSFAKGNILNNTFFIWDLEIFHYFKSYIVILFTNLSNFLIIRLYILIPIKFVNFKGFTLPELHILLIFSTKDEQCALIYNRSLMQNRVSKNPVLIRTSLLIQDSVTLHEKSEAMLQDVGFSWSRT